MTSVDRFWSKVSLGYEEGISANGCYIWKGTRRPKGYGLFKWRGQMRGAHRVAWELTYGPIPEGLMVLHRCDTPACVRPDHLFLGDNFVNQRDSVAKGRARNGSSYKTHCPQGHAYEETDYGYSTGRVCRVCKRETARRWYYTHGGSAGRRERRARAQGVPETGGQVPRQT